MPRWHTDYDRADDGYRVTCPYCQSSTTRPFLSEALKAGLTHEGKCPARATTDGEA